MSVTEIIGMHRRRMINFCFHGIGVPERELETNEAEYWVSEQLFIEALDLIARTENATLSFDDGNSSDVAIALPALRKRGLRASFFPLAGRIGQPGSLDGSDLRELVRHGMTVGSHGMRHVSWAGLSEADLEEELVQARAIISSAAGVSVSAAACPFGSYDRRALHRLRSLDYLQVCTSDRAAARARSRFQPRFTVVASDDLESIETLLAGPSRMSTATSELRIAIKRWR